jgi:hypothetical protein
VQLRMYRVFLPRDFDAMSFISLFIYGLANRTGSSGDVGAGGR